MSCEIPNKNKYPHLYSVIVRHNIHGLCENLNPKNVGMEANKSCKYKYHRDFCNITVFGQNSYRCISVVILVFLFELGAKC